MTMSTTATHRPHRSGLSSSALIAALLAVTIGCASQTEQELKSALREYVGDTTTTSESVMSAPPPSATMPPPRGTPTSPSASTTTTTTTTTTTAVPHVGDGRTISQVTADQVDRCLAGWQTMRLGAETSGRLDRDEFRRIATDCDEAVQLLGLDRSDEAITTGPTEQLHAVLLQLRLQWTTPTMEFDRACPTAPGTRCALEAGELGGSFDFLVISGPSTIFPTAFLDQVDGPLDVSQIPGLMVE